MTPENQGLGLRIVFQPDGYGVGVYPGLVPPSVPGLPTPTGEPAWTYEYRVVDADSGEALEETISFTVDENADPIPQETPPSCVPQGGTATPGGATFPPNATPGVTARPTRTPITTDSAGNTPEPGSTDAPADDDDDDGATTEGDDDGSDVLLLALITIGIVGALGGAALIGFVIRRRIGFDPHKPGPSDDSVHH